MNDHLDMVGVTLKATYTQTRKVNGDAIQNQTMESRQIYAYYSVGLVITASDPDAAISGNLTSRGLLVHVSHGFTKFLC